MKNFKKHVLLLTSALCSVFCLTACGGGYTEEDCIAQVTGNIDEIYLGVFDKDYLESVELTEAEAKQYYLDGIEVEAEYFANYWGIVVADYGETYADLDQDLQMEIIELYKEIYNHTKYEVVSAAKQHDGSFSVKVTVDPIDIMQTAYDLYMNNGYEPLNAFWEKYENVDFTTMTDEEYLAYTNEYGHIIVSLISDQLSDLGYMDQKSLVLQVAEDDEGYMTINEDDWYIFDSYIIYYP